MTTELVITAAFAIISFSLFVVLAIRIRQLEQATKDLIHCRGQLTAMQREISSLWNVIRDFTIIFVTAHASNGDVIHKLSQSLYRQLQEAQRLLRFTEEQIALYSPSTAPPHLLAERERLQEFIRSIQAQIDSTQVKP